MGATPLGSYASSTALSATHYQLVTAVEQAHSAEHANQALVACLSRVKTSWAKRAPSPSTARHDLVLVLYCRSQRTDTGDDLDDEAEELFQAAWALPVAVMLAGGGGKGAIHYRDMGYRACAELFSPLEPHPLKLLLVNTIRTDLYAPLDSPKAEARRALALRAAASTAIASPELIPAIREHVLELLLDPSYSEPIRRLALEALLSLIRVAESSSSANASSLVIEVRDAVLSILLPPPPSSSSSTSGRHRSGRPSRQPHLSLVLLTALSSALSPPSPLYPVLPDAQQRVQLHLALLRRILDAPEEDGRRTRFQGVRGVWATSRALEALRAQLAETSAAAEESARGVEAIVWEVVARMLEGANEPADAVVLSALRLLPFLPSAIGEQHVAALSALLARLYTHLTAPTSPAALLFTLRALALLPPSAWAAPSSTGDSDSKGKSRAATPPLSQSQWGEPAWRAILATLDHPDSTIRRAALALLQRVDGSLVRMQYERLLVSLATPMDTEASVRSSASGGSARTTAAWGRKRTERVLALVLEVLPFLSPAPSPASSSTPSTLPPPAALLALLHRPELALTPTTVRPALVVPVLQAFEHAPADVQRAFARGVLLEGDAWGEGVLPGLWAAGSVHVLEGEEARRAVERLSEWLADEDGTTNPDLLPLLQEPFLYALLRLLALRPSLASSSALHARVLRAARASTSPETTRLFALLARCTDPVSSSADNPPAELLIELEALDPFRPG
ncbi:hypothetical protein JCM10449v2_002016 [Rhodotorula kratochvilovae]